MSPHYAVDVCFVHISILEPLKTVFPYSYCRVTFELQSVGLRHYMLLARRLNVRPSVTLRFLKFSNQLYIGRNIHNKVVFSGIQPTGVPHVRSQGPLGTKRH
jgi:hypothetical protein